MNKRGLDRKGDTDWGVIFALVIGVLVVIALVWWFMGGFSSTTGSIGSLTQSELQSVVTGCQAVQVGSADYCANLRTPGKGVFVTCDSSYIEAKLGTKASCDSSAYTSSLNADCHSKIKSFPATVYVGDLMAKGGSANSDGGYTLNTDKDCDTLFPAIPAVPAK